MEEAIAMPAYVTLAEGIIASDYALKNLNKSLGEAQNEFAPAVKNEENKWGGYKYTPLEGIIKAVRPATTKYHLTMSQFPLIDLETKVVSMVSRLVHWDSGEWIQHTFELPGELALGKDGAPKFNQQTIGGSSTYAQKYAYKAILGIPDAEEMIDSSEEKGDLPARSKTRGTPAQRQQETIEVAAQLSASRQAPAAEPTEEDVRLWTEAFSEAPTLEDFNKLIVPMMKERADNPRYGRKFIVAVAATAKNRGYTVDRATGAYKQGATPPKKEPTVEEYEQAYEERQGTL